MNFCSRTKENKTPLQLAIQCRLQPVVDALCKKGADLNSCDEKNNCPLWVALKSGQQDIASTLVSYFQLLENMIKSEENNRPFPNFFKPVPQSEAWCTTIHMKMRFSFTCKLNSFSCELLCTKPLFDGEA